MGQAAEAFRLLLGKIGPQEPVMKFWVKVFFLDGLRVFQALSPSIAPLAFEAL